jgi:hypothetical protein
MISTVWDLVVSGLSMPTIGPVLPQRVSFGMNVVQPNGSFDSINVLMKYW